MRVILLIAITILNIPFLYSQERGQLFTRNYTPKEYNASTQNWAIVQDKRGVMYFANQGVLEFDGEKWREIPIKNNSSVRSLSIDSLGVIYVGAVGEFGYLSPDNNGKLQYISLLNLVDSTYKQFSDVWCTRSTKSGTYFLTNNFLFCYDGTEIKVLHKTAKYFYLSMNVNNILYVQEIGAGLKRIVNDSLQLIPKGNFFVNSKIFTILPYEKNKLLIGTRNKGLFIYSSENNKTEIIPFKNLSKVANNTNQFILKNKLYGGIKLHNNFALATLKNGVIIINKNGDILKTINKESSIQNDAVYALLNDRNDNLWLGLDNGISHVEINSPFVYWNSKNNLEGTIIDIIRFKGRLYVATGSGIYFLDKNNSSTINQFIKVKGIDEQSWSFLKFKINSKKILLAATSYGVYKIVDGKAKKIIDNIQAYKLYNSKLTPERVFVGIKGGLISIYWNKKSKSWTVESKIEIKNFEVRGIVEDKNKNLWAEVPYKGVYKIKFNKNNFELKLYNKLNGLPSVREVKIYNFHNNLLFATDSGVYRFNYKKNIFYPDKIFNNINISRTNRVNSFAEDKNGNVWINGSRVLIKQGNNHFKIDTIPFKRFTQSNSEAIFIDTNNIVWIGGSEGLYRYNPKYVKNYFKPYYTLIRKVKNSDSTIFYGSNFITSKNQKRYICLKQNDKQIPNLLYRPEYSGMIFEYAAPFYENGVATKYSYYLKGFDKEWSSWSYETKKEYTFLHEGEYTFMVKAKNIYDIESKPASYKFVIQPPWYRTYYAYLLYLIISVLIIRFFVFINTKLLLAKNRKLEETVAERTSEILQQKEEILTQSDNIKKAYENISIQNIELEQQKEEILAQSEQLLSKNIELEKLTVVARETDNAIAVFDKTGNIEWINEGFTGMYGYTLEQLINEKGRSIISHSVNPKIKDIIRSCIDNKETAIYEYSTTTKSNDGLWIQTTLTPIFDDNDEVINFIAIDSNITKIKDAENEIIFQKEEIEKKSKQLEKLSIVARETNNAIVIMDDKGNFEWVNESFMRMYGYTLQQFIKEKGGNIVAASYNKDIKNLTNKWLGKKEPISYQALNVTKSGEKIWAQTTLTPIVDDNGKVIKIVSIDSDITKLKQAEEQIQKQRDELQKANITKDKFFSIIAHDLRSPFATFVSLTNVVYQSFDNFTHDKLKSIAFDLHNSAEKTFNLLENLLDWSRSQKGEIQFRPKKNDINSLINENIELFQNLSNKKNISLFANTPKNTFAFYDEDMIQTVIRNLISNALKFTHSGGKINIKVSDFDDKVEISVSDTGIGIEEDDLINIFRIDYHHTTLGTEDEKGTGLGLILCKEFVEKNNGTISVESQIGKGSTFVFTLPKK